jgi:hypothetical protein
MKYVSKKLRASISRFQDSYTYTGTVFGPVPPHQVRLWRLRKEDDDRVIWHTTNWAELDGETGDMLEFDIGFERVYCLDPKSPKPRLRLVSSQA